MLVVLRFTPVDGGAQSVMTHGALTMPMLPVISWDLHMPWQPTAVQHLDRDLVPYCWMI